MSKKVVRAQQSFAKKWISVIGGSLLASTVQSANAAERPNVSHSHIHSGSRAETIGHSASHHTRHMNWSARTDRSNRDDSARAIRIQNNHHSLLRTVQDTISGATVHLNSGVDLDLSAGDTNITLGQNLFAKEQSVTITVGGEQKTFVAGSQVSSAEYVAVKQVLATGTQQINIDGAGRATSGEVNLNDISGPRDVIRANSLVVPENVSTYGVFGRGSEFRLTGDLNNYGNLYALSNNRQGGIVHADDIINHSGALISSIAPTRGIGHHSTDLAMVADGSFVNDGSIVSGGNLSIDSGASLTNTGHISSTNNISLDAPTINNSGHIESINGNINLNGPDSAVLAVNNTGGQLSAVNGAINLRAADYTGTADTQLFGGKLDSSAFNINAGNASATVNVNQLTGTVNQTGMAVHVDAATEDLNIGNVCLTGDPTYRNTLGNINITGNITVGEDLVIAASGDITSNNGVIITAGDTTGGYPITMIAGVNFISAVGGSDVATLPPLGAGSNITLGLNSLTGGSIKLGSGSFIVARATDIVGNDPGADIHLIAFQGISPFSGEVNTQGSTLNSSGTNNGTNGNIEIIAATKANVGVVIAQGFNTGSGALTVTTAQPFPNKAGLVSYNTVGARTSTDFYVPGTTSGTTAFINLTGTITASDVTVLAGGDLTVSSPINSSGIHLTTNSNFTMGNSITGSVVKFDVGGTFLPSAGTLSASTILLISVGDTIIGTPTASFKAGTIGIFSSNGNVGSSAASRLQIDADSLSLQALNGSVFINDSDDLTVSQSNVSGTLDLVAAKALTVSSALFWLADKVNLRSTTDAIVLTGNINAGTSASLHASTDITGAGVVTAPFLALTADKGSIGNGILNPVHTNADSVAINAPLGNASVSDTDQLNFGGGSTFVGQTLSAISPGNLSSSSSIIANTAVFSGNTINFASPIIASTSLGIISATDLTNGNISGGLSSPFVLLNSTGGNIGTSAAAPLVIDAATLGLGANNGSVFVSDPNSMTLSSTVVKGTLSVVTGGDLSVTGVQNNTGSVIFNSGGGINIAANVTSSAADVTLTATKGTLSIADSTNISAVTGITLLHTGTNVKTDKIAIGKNDQLTTSGAGGNIAITLGTGSGKVGKKVPRNIQVVNIAGKVSFQGKGVVTAVAPINVLTAKSANIALSNSVAATNLTMGGNVVITAD